MAVPAQDYSKMTDEQVQDEFKKADDALKVLGAVDFRNKRPRNLREWRDHMQSEMDRRNWAAQLAAAIAKDRSRPRTQIGY